MLQAKSNYYRRLAPRRGVRPRGDVPPLTIDQWLSGLGDPARVVVVAAGPTARDLVPQADSLHVATNSSEAVVHEHTYVNFLTEGYPVTRYLKNGPASSSCRGTFFRFETRGRPQSQTTVARRAVADTRRFLRACPDVVSSDVDEDGVERDNFERYQEEILRLTGMEMRQYNSGFGATYLGLFLAATFQVPLEIYGLDAGVGGQKHFDGSQMESPSVVGERVRGNLKILLDLLYRQERVEVTNRSAFYPEPEA